MPTDLPRLAPSTLPSRGRQIPACAAWTTVVTTAYGDLWLAVTEDGLLRSALDPTEQTWFDLLAGDGCTVLTGRQMSHSPLASVVAARLDARDSMVDVPIDWRGHTPFAVRALRATQSVGWGALASYRDIAIQIGAPYAYRAVGNALNGNRCQLVIPCHRIVKSDGSLGGYGGDRLAKQRLLAVEGTLLP